MLLFSHFKCGDFLSKIFDCSPSRVSLEVEVVLDSVVEPPVSANGDGLAAWQFAAGDGDVP